MDIQGIIQDDKKKKYLIIGLIAIFFILALVFFLTRNSNSGAQDDSQAQLLEDFAKLSPRSGSITSTRSLMPKIALLADRTTVDPGQPVKISWETRNAESCVDINGDALELTGSKSVLPKEPYTFDILCTSPEGTDLQSITIAVTGFPSIALQAYPNEVKSGEPSVISWDATNVDRCVDNTGKVLRLSGGLSVSPKSPYTFNISCTGPKGTTKKSVTVSIAKPIATRVSDGATGGTRGTSGVADGTSDTGFDPWAAISSLFGGSDSGAMQKITLDTPTNVEYGSTAKVKWTLKNVDPLGCVFSNTVPNSWLKPLYPSSGSVVSSPLYETQTITISCTKGTENVQKSATITVVPKAPPPDPNFTSPLKSKSNYEYTATGMQTSLVWAAKNASRCSLSKNGVVVKTIPGNGDSVSITERTVGIQSYALECINTEGVIVKSGPISIHVIDCSFTNGFGDSLDEINNVVQYGDDPNLKIEPGTRYGRSEPYICTYTYGDPVGTAENFAKVFYSTIPNTLIIDYKDGAYGTSFCPYTRYQKIEMPNMGVQTVDLLDKKYHPAWEKLGSTAELMNHNNYGWNLVSFIEIINLTGDHFNFSDTVPTALNQHGGNHNWDFLMNQGVVPQWIAYQKNKYGTFQGIFAYMNSLTCLVK